MKIINKLLILLMIVFTINSCGKKDEEEVEYKPPIITEWGMSCLRWFDRSIYFATSSVVNNDRNNTFDKQTVQDLLKVLELNTKLGEDYFKIKTKNEDLLQPIRPNDLRQEDYDSFILIWEDSKFNQFVNTELGGFNNIPDRNAITIVNSRFGRKFYMIIRASCFDGDVGYQCNQIGVKGLNALIARQIGYMLKLPPANCSLYPNNVLCPEAKDSQWDTENREVFFNLMTSQLITIENNKNFYNDIATSEDCLTKPFMDKELYVGSPDGLKNNTFFVQDVFETLEDIACNSILGCGYFIKPSETIPEKDIPIYFEKTETATRGKSYLMIWPDIIFNGFVTNHDLNIIDPNAILFFNQAYKRNYTMILRASCFDSNNEFCDGGNGGITRNGLSALIARQLGMLVGMEAKDCSKEPHHVMCTELPSDAQWTDNEKTRFYNQFNNALEYIGNNKDFYFEYTTTTVEE